MDRFIKLAERQLGVVDVDQRGTVTKRQVRSNVKRGRMHRVLPGVVRVAGAPTSWEQDVKAMVLWSGPDAPASHFTAARLHGFPPFIRRDDLHVSTASREVRHRKVRVHRINPLAPGDFDKVRLSGVEFTVTSVPRTLLDLAPLVSFVALRACLDDSLCRKKVTLDELVSFVNRSRGRRGIRVLRRLVASRCGEGGPTESELERRGLALIERAGLPVPIVQKRMRLSTRVARLDFLYPSHRLVIELDGYASHSGVESFESDRRRANALVQQNFAILQWTWESIRSRQHLLIAELRAVLKVRAPVPG